MAFLFCDNFAHYEGTGDLRRKWSQIADSSTFQSPHVLIAPNAGVYGSPRSACLSLGGNANDFIRIFAPGGGPSEVFFNGYFQLHSMNTSTSNKMIMRFTDTNGSQQAIRFLGTANNIRAEHGSGFTTGTNPVKFFPEWNYLAIRLKVDPVVGVFQVYLNGVLEVNFAGDTQGAALVTAQEKVHLAGDAGDNTGGYVLWDHVLIYDATATSMNTLITDRIQVQTLRPTADNGAQQWLLSTGADHYALVDENVTDTSDFLIGTNVAGDKDNFDLGNLPRAATTVHTVVPTVYARRTDATGTNNIRLAVVSGGTAGLSGNIAMAAQSTTYTHSLDVDPNTLAAWGSSAVDAAILRIQIGT